MVKKAKEQIYIGDLLVKEDNMFRAITHIEFCSNKMFIEGVALTNVNIHNEVVMRPSERMESKC